MKITLQQIESGEEEVLVRYKTMTPRLAEAMRMLQQEKQVILGKDRDQKICIDPAEIYYFEAVDEKCFACTDKMTYQVAMTLAEAEHALRASGFFRCSKSLVINIKKVASLKSEMGNRINATLDNGEHVIISRRYAREFREILKNCR